MLKPVDDAADTREAFLNKVNKAFLNQLTPKHTKLGAAIEDTQAALTGMDITSEGQMPPELGTAQCVSKKCEAISVKWAIYTLQIKYEAGEDVTAPLKKLNDAHMTDETTKGFLGQPLVDKMALMIEEGTLHAAEKERNEKKKKKKEKEEETATAAEPSEPWEENAPDEPRAKRTRARHAGRGRGKS